jgi:hypothetical protein
MKRTRWATAVVTVAAGAGLVWAQGAASPSLVVPRDGNVLLQQDGKPPRKAKVMKTYRQADGTLAHQVRVLDTGEVLTIRDGRPDTKMPPAKQPTTLTRMFGGQTTPAPADGKLVDVRPYPSQQTRSPYGMSGAVAARPATPPAATPAVNSPAKPTPYLAQSTAIVPVAGQQSTQSAVLPASAPPTAPAKVDTTAHPGDPPRAKDRDTDPLLNLKPGEKKAAPPTTAELAASALARRQGKTPAPVAPAPVAPVRMPAAQPTTAAAPMAPTAKLTDKPVQPVAAQSPSVAMRPVTTANVPATAPPATTTTSFKPVNLVPSNPTPMAPVVAKPMAPPAAAPLAPVAAKPTAPVAAAPLAPVAAKPTAPRNIYVPPPPVVVAGKDTSIPPPPAKPEMAQTLRMERAKEAAALAAATKPTPRPMAMVSAPSKSPTQTVAKPMPTIAPPPPPVMKPVELVKEQDVVPGVLPVPPVPQAGYVRIEGPPAVVEAPPTITGKATVRIEGPAFASDESSVASMPSLEAQPLPVADAVPPADPTTAHWLTQLVEALGPSERQQAASALVYGPNRHDPQVLGAVVHTALTDPAATVRAHCVRCLVDVHGSSPAFLAALPKLSQDTDETVRSEAARASQGR